MEKRDAARIRALERQALRKPLSLWEQAELAQLKRAAAVEKAWGSMAHLKITTADFLREKAEEAERER